MQETAAFWSGHANSSAMILRMIEKKDSPDLIVHAVTRAEFNIVYDFMEKFQKICDVEIIFEDIATNNPNKEFMNFFNKPWCKGNHIGIIHGMPYASHPCWHNRNIKQPVYNKYEKKCSITYTGFHCGERNRVLKNRLNKRYPLIEWGWNDKDSLEYLRKKDIPHLAYDKYGFERLGCWFCPRQKDSALYIIFKNFPEQFEILLDMEDKSPHGFRAGTSLHDLIEKWEKQPNKTLSDF